MYFIDNNDVTKKDAFMRNLIVIIHNLTTIV